MTTEISKAAHECLANWTGGKPSIALMGEFSAGKSTLLNLLMGEDVLPTKVTATILPSVWLCWSDTPFMQGLSHDGSLHDVTFDELGETVRDDYLCLRIGRPIDILRDRHLVDTPGISDPTLAKGATAFLGDYLDFVIWCSPANQAWRQTEKTVWSAFPEHLREKSLLVLTRADKLRRATDLEKVIKRAKRETEDLFHCVLPLDTPRAARSNGAGADWTESGGADFDAALIAAMASVDVKSVTDPKPGAAVAEKEQAAPVVAKVTAEPEPTVAAAKPEAKPQVAVANPEPKAEPGPTVKPAVAQTEAPKAKAVQSQPAKAKKTASKAKSRSLPKTAKATGIVADFNEHLKLSGQVDCHAKLTSIFGQFVDKLIGDNTINPTQRFVLKQCLSAGEDPNVDVERLIEQVRKDLTDFDQDSWCVLSAA